MALSYPIHERLILGPQEKVALLSTRIHCMHPPNSGEYELAVEFEVSNVDYSGLWKTGVDVSECWIGKFEVRTWITIRP